MPIITPKPGLGILRSAAVVLCSWLFPAIEGPVPPRAIADLERTIPHRGPSTVYGPPHAINCGSEPEGRCRQDHRRHQPGRCALVAQGHRVLLVDVNPQGDATSGLGHEDLYEGQVPNLLQALTGRLPEQVTGAALIVGAGAIHLLPSNLDLALAERLQLTSIRAGLGIDVHIIGIVVNAHDDTRVARRVDTDLARLPVQG